MIGIAAGYRVIAEQACVEGEIHSDHLGINGEAQACIFSGNLLEIEPSARIIGEVSDKVLEMHGGAQVLGTLTQRDGLGVASFLAAAGA